MKPLQIDWRVVLVRPRNPLNIGAVARALANFGLRDMRVVAPFEPTWQEARSAAVGAEPVVESARAVPTLLDAIGDATLVLGTTTGQRRHLERDLLPLPELAAWLARRKVRGRAALLFGSEKTGLSNEDLSMCHALVRIPTTPDCVSMNLGQAVAVCAYELARAGAVAARTPPVTVRRSGPANLEALERLFDRAAQVLDVSGYLKPKSRAAMLIKLRRLLLDLNLSSHAARVLGGVLAQVEWKLGQIVKGEL
jgi:TrmH family RNA methyltransferase